VQRAYTVVTAALVLGVPIKWLDNVLSHFSLQGIVQERQGVARRITIEGMLQLYLVHSLSSELGTTIVVATQVAQKLAADGLVELSNGITIRYTAPARAWVVPTNRIAELESLVAQPATPRELLPEKAPKDVTWISPFGPLTTNAPHQGDPAFAPGRRYR